MLQSVGFLLLSQVYPMTTTIHFSGLNTRPGFSFRPTSYAGYPVCTWIFLPSWWLTFSRGWNFRILWFGICQWKWDTRLNKLNSHVVAFRFIDPYSRWKLRRLRYFSFEALGILFKCCPKDNWAIFVDSCRQSVVNILWSHQSNAWMTMFFIVPSNEILAEGSGILNTPETVGKCRTIL